MKTSTFQRGLLLGTALLVGMPLSAAAKCPMMFFRPERLVVIDGRQATEVELTELTTLHAESIYAIEILCWNPADSTFNQGVGIGMPVTQVVTKALMDGLIADLQQVSAAQRSFFAKRSTNTDQLGQLEGFTGSTAGASIELSAGPTGWSATATKPGMVHRCAVVAGEATPPAMERSYHVMPTSLVTHLEDGVPGCFVSVAASGKLALSLGG